MRTCGNCTFWNRFSDAEDKLDYGECRRYPPVDPVASKEPIILSFNMGKDQRTTYRTSDWYIHTRLYDWCGECMTLEQFNNRKL